jgi:hypothetical protein
MYIRVAKVLFCRFAFTSQALRSTDNLGLSFLPYLEVVHFGGTSLRFTVLHHSISQLQCIYNLIRMGLNCLHALSDIGVKVTSPSHPLAVSAMPIISPTFSGRSVWVVPPSHLQKTIWPQDASRKRHQNGSRREPFRTTIQPSEELSRFAALRR